MRGSTVVDANPYDSTFYLRQQKVALSSAQHIVPLVLELLQPQSVVDVGCGDGTWLSEFQRCGIKTVLGFDGDYVGRGTLKLDTNCFEPRDLQKDYQITRVFELAVSLEVAEHLPAECAVPFVHFLCSLAPAVLFSAAIPMQGGRQHLNEQWQDYWAERFLAEGFNPIDCIRARVWENNSVAVWYAQNTLLYVKRVFLDQQPELLNLAAQHKSLPLNIVHPRLFLQLMEPKPRSGFGRVKARLKQWLKP